MTEPKKIADLQIGDSLIERSGGTTFSYNGPSPYRPGVGWMSRLGGGPLVQIRSAQLKRYIIVRHERQSS